MNFVEERFVFEGGHIATALRVRQYGLLEAIQHIRRTLIPQALGLGAPGAAQKFAAFVKDLLYETSACDLPARRDTVSCWFADQGTDIAVGDSPNDKRSDIKQLCERIHRGEIDFAADGARDGYFLPEAVTIPEFLHGIFWIVERGPPGHSCVASV